MNPPDRVPTVRDVGRCLNRAISVRVSAPGTNPATRIAGALPPERRSFTALADDSRTDQPALADADSLACSVAVAELVDALAGSAALDDALVGWAALVVVGSLTGAVVVGAVVGVVGGGVVVG